MNSLLLTFVQNEQTRELVQSLLNEYKVLKNISQTKIKFIKIGFVCKNYLCVYP